eukprot:NODE_2078_length_658_cov_95.231638_g2028_i0.p1 GENE.NODE_2078_length_658_cov_95.231638_g2028_i0~~NODE_2078_length_658_cov_95.231638_g2028_i0.p1  ORF type:complete len:189 (+),score=11.58 NODE_2078_length_658_cov_95.231638_g2028_i0:57-623(+)
MAVRVGNIVRHVARPARTAMATSPLYTFRRVAGHLANTESSWTEVNEDNGRRKFIVQTRVTKGPDGKPLKNLPSELQWHSFLNVHPTALDAVFQTTDCVLCGSCTASCPSYWWNNEKYLGPAAMLQSWRWFWDQNNDTETFNRRMKEMQQTLQSVNFCHNIGNCTQVCPKNINVDKMMLGLKVLSNMA